MTWNKEYKSGNSAFDQVREDFYRRMNCAKTHRDLEVGYAFSEQKDAKDKHNEVMSLYVDDYEYASRLVEYAYLKYLDEESYQTVDIARQIFLMQNILRHEKRVYEDYKKALEAKKESV